MPSVRLRRQDCVHEATELCVEQNYMRPQKARATLATFPGPWAGTVSVFHTNTREYLGQEHLVHSSTRSIHDVSLYAESA